jgi:uncharacterized protein YjiS (DUF1127 family)
MTILSTNYSQCIERNSSNVQGGLYLMLQHWFKTLELKEKVNQERRQLLEMTDAMLSDIGITRAQANAEANRVDLPAERINALQKGRC